MKQSRVIAYNRNDIALTKFTLGMLFSPLVVLLAMASILSL